jgi:hypothetical protein
MSKRTNEGLNTLPEDYVQRWRKFAEWAIESKHGLAAKMAVAFSLCISAPWSTSPALLIEKPKDDDTWLVTSTMKGAKSSRRVSLLPHETMQALLLCIDESKNMKASLYPATPCGSTDGRAWACGPASRQLMTPAAMAAKEGLAVRPKNFAAISEAFGLSASPSWTTNTMCAASRAVFQASFEWSGEETASILTSQYGLANSHRIHDHEGIFVLKAQVRRALRMDSEEGLTTW